MMGSSCEDEKQPRGGATKMRMRSNGKDEEQQEGEEHQKGEEQQNGEELLNGEEQQDGEEL